MELSGGIWKKCGWAPAVLLCCILIQISVLSFREIPVTSPLQDTGSIYIAGTMNVISRSAVTQRTTDYRSLSHLPSNNNTAAVICFAFSIRPYLLHLAGLISDIPAGMMPESTHSPNTVSRK